MNSNGIKDDELEKVNGGKKGETNELRNIFNTGSVVDIKSILSQHGIEAHIFDDCNQNKYVVKDTGKKLDHQQLINLIKENRWNS